MILAAMKVLPVPVAPRSTWLRSPASIPGDELGDGGRLVAGGLELGREHEGLAALELGAARILDGDGKGVD